MLALSAVSLLALFGFIQASDGHIRNLNILRNPFYKENYSSSRSETSGSFSGSSGDETALEEPALIPIIEACRACDLEEVKRIAEADPDALKVMDWRPLYGMAATADSGKCLELLNYILSTSKIPQAYMTGALMAASNHGHTGAFKAIYEKMIEHGYKLSSLSFSDVCVHAPPTLLRYLLDTGTISKALIADGAQRAFRMEKVESLNMLTRRLDEDAVSDLVPNIINSVKALGCPDALESIFQDEIFQRAAAANANRLFGLTKDMIRKSLKNPTFSEFVKVVDVLLRLPFIAENLCSKELMHQVVTNGHVSLGIVIRRRCPHILYELEVKYFAEAMKKKGATEVFEEFADVFIMAEYDYMETFLAALHRLDRGLIETIYGWAKANDYLIGLDVRMAVADLAMGMLSNPLKLTDPELYKQRQQFIQLAKAKTKELNKLKQQLAGDLGNREISGKISEIKMVIANAFATAESIKVDEDSILKLKRMKRRLETLVYTESEPLFKLKEVAKKRNLSNLLKVLSGFSHKPDDPRDPNIPEEFEWY